MGAVRLTGRFAGHDGRVNSESDFDRLARRVYVTARAGAVDREAAFDLACQVLEDCPLDEAAAELALVSVEDPDEARLAEVALRVLAEFFAPGFDEEPEWLAALRGVMDVVNADMRATGLPGTGLVTVPDPNLTLAHAYVEVWDRYAGTGGGIPPSCGSNPISALVAVADDAQDAVMHAIWAAWPVCPVHSVGVHAEEHDGTAVWWCRGGGGHVAGLIGRWGES